MKNILFALLCMLSMTTFAQNDAKYLAGAVPEQDGRIVFSKTFPTNNLGKDKTVILLTNYIKEKLMAPAIQDIRTRLISDGLEDNTVVARVEEYITFKRKPLYLDRTRIRYQITAVASDNEVKVDISQISYYYNEGMDGNNGITYRAEEWISDKEALNKKGTKLYPRSGKFRRKTVDRMEEIFNGLEEALAQ